MTIKIATWNINSVRLRADLVRRFLAEAQPDVLCLQETKCPPGQFPSSAFSDLSYTHIAENGQAGHHGVAIVSRLAFKATGARAFCGKDDTRHVSAILDTPRPLTVHSLYVPAGGDEPDPAVNDKFAHKLRFIGELADWLTEAELSRAGPTVLAGDFNIAPHENDVWSHKRLLKVVSHTPVEVDGLGRVQAAGNWIDIARELAGEEDKLYTWWSYRARDWAAADRGRRLDHIWIDQSLRDTVRSLDIYRAARGWERPSDLAPVMARFEL